MGYKYHSRQQERWSDMDHHAKHSCHCRKKERWSALEDDANHHPMSHCNCGREEEDVAVDAKVSSDIDQLSHELIVIRDSCNVTVSTTDTQIAASLQAALQVAIAVVVNISILDGNRAERVTAELLEKSQIRQTNRQKLIIVNSRDVEVTTEDIDVAISLQLLLQILLALIVQLDIL